MSNNSSEELVRAEWQVLQETDKRNLLEVEMESRGTKDSFSTSFAWSTQNNNNNSSSCNNTDSNETVIENLLWTKILFSMLYIDSLM